MDLFVGLERICVAMCFCDGLRIRPRMADLKYLRGIFFDPYHAGSFS